MKQTALAETWRDIRGYEGIYKVSDQGRIMRIAVGSSTHPGKILKPLVASVRRSESVQLCFNGSFENRQIARVVVEAFIGSPGGMQVDHINGDKSDHRLVNLRIVTGPQNAKNKGPYKTSKFAVKGVTFRRNRYEARIQVDGKRITLGTFHSLHGAIEAYKVAEQKFYGEFARGYHEKT